MLPPMETNDTLTNAARALGITNLEALTGEFTDENGAPAIAFHADTPLSLHLFDLFRIEDKLSEIAGITVMLFPRPSGLGARELLGEQ